MSAPEPLKPGFRVRGPNVWGNWGIYFGRRKVGSAGSKADALDWIKEHDEHGNRLAPLEPLVMTKFNWETKNENKE